MASSVPLPEFTDQFSSELCSLLSKLATTEGTRFNSLKENLVSLRAALLQAVAVEQTEDSVDSEDGEEGGTAGERTVSSAGELDHTSSSVSSGEEGGATARVELSPCCQEVGTGSGDSPGMEEHIRQGASQGSRSPQARRSPPDPRRPAREVENNRRLMLSLQRGSAWQLEERRVKQALGQLGHVVKLVLRPGHGRYGFIGFVEYRTKQSAAGATNRLVKAGKCALHTSLPFDCWSERPIPYQILVESVFLPNIWEQEMILRNFFNKFGPVTAVTNIFPVSSGEASKMLRFIISFEDGAVASELVGTNQKLLSCQVMVKEVSTNTIRRSP